MKERLEKVSLKDFELFYEVYGNGNTAVLCLHGNSRSAKDFQFLENSDRKIISIHLFFHEYSTFDEKRIKSGDIYTEDFNALIQLILVKENVNHFHWLAYSQGGRFTFASYPFLATKVDSLTLIAPDGLDDSNFYSWSQRQFTTRWLFRYLLKHPTFLEKAVAILVKMKVLHPKMNEFISFYTSDQETFEMAYKTWSSFRNIRPSVDAIKTAIEKHETPFKIIIGEHDHIITEKTARKFTEKIGKSDSVQTIPSGHNVFKPHIQSKLYEIMESIMD